MSELHDLLTPSSLTVVGASDNPARIGGRSIEYCLRHGYPGDIWPVNPTRDRVQGLPAFAHLRDVPGPLDFVLIAIPAPLVVETVEAAIAKGARTILVFSSGFAEESAEGAAWQARLTELARASGTRIIGPNCLGAFNAAHNFYATFSGTIDKGPVTPGGISIASQSGAYGSHIFYVSKLRGLGVRYWITTGNECDLHTAEAIGMLVRDPDVHTVMAYAESIKDGGALVTALEDARAERKPVIMMKVGRTALGAEAASSHTASLAGEDPVYDAVLRHHGCFRASTTEEMLDIAHACRPRIYPVGRKLGIVTISGGAGVLMADAAVERDLDVAAMPDAAQAALLELVPFASPRNPVDVTAQFFNDMSLVPKFTQAMLDHGSYDGLIGFWTSVAGNRHLADKLVEGLTEAMEGRTDIPFFQSLLAPDAVRDRYEAAGFPTFEDPTRAVNAMAALMQFGAAFAQIRPATPELPDMPPLPDGPMTEPVAKAVLAEAGIPVVADKLARTAEDAAHIARESAGVLAMKIVSPDIAHKSDIGGVALKVTQQDAADTFDTLIAAARAARPDAGIEGVMISPMLSGGTEMILGARIDPVFGPVVMVGLGGVFAEVLGDVAIRPAPIDTDIAHEMLASLQGFGLLRGARGTPPADLGALAAAISALSIFAAVHKNTIRSVELNPVLALPDGCVALDALIVREE